MQSTHPLREWRKSQAKPLSQTELGEKLGIGPSQISQIESGLRGCSLAVAIKIVSLTDGAVPLESLVATNVEAAE